MAKSGKPRINTDISFQKFNLADLNPAPYNPRKISEDNLAGLKHSLEKFGLVQPIVVNIRDGKNVIVGGHQRHKVLVSESVKTAVCVTVDRSEEDERLLNITLNNPKIQGEFFEDLDAYIGELQKEVSSNLDLLNLRITKLRSQIFDAGKEGFIDDDYAPELPSEPKTQKGDIWELGIHKLICGDCLDDKILKKLFNNQTHKPLPVDMVFTDPPYNMNYQSKPLGGIKNDKMSEVAFIQFILKSIGSIRRFLKNGGSYYICMSAAEYPTVYHQLRKLGLKGRQLIWCKESLGLGSQEYRPRFEVMLFGYSGDRNKRTWNGQRGEYDLWDTNSTAGIIARADGKGMIIEVGQGIETWQIILPQKITGKVLHFDGTIDDLWAISREHNCYVHPTQKPVKLITRAILNSSNEDDLIWDPFCGSGTTIIAAEKLGRRCYGIELDEGYCDVAVKRWEDWTGKKAKLVR